LAAQGFEGDIAVAYEFNPGKHLPEVVKCIQFLKGFAGAQRKIVAGERIQ